MPVELCRSEPRERGRCRGGSTAPQGFLAGVDAMQTETLKRNTVVAWLATIWMTAGCALSVTPGERDAGNEAASHADAAAMGDTPVHDCVFPSGRSCAAGTSCPSDDG